MCHCITDMLHQPSLSPSALIVEHQYMQGAMTVLLHRVHAQQLAPARAAAHRPEAEASSQPADAGFSTARYTTTQSLEPGRWLAKRLQRAWLQQQLMRSWDLGVEAMCLGPRLRCSKTGPGRDRIQARASMVLSGAAVLPKVALFQGRGSALSGRVALLLRLLARAGTSGSSKGSRRAPASPGWWLCPAPCRLRPRLCSSSPAKLLQPLGLVWALAEQSRHSSTGKKEPQAEHIHSSSLGKVTKQPLGMLLTAMILMVFGLAPQGLAGSGAAEAGDSQETSLTTGGRT